MYGKKDDYMAEYITLFREQQIKNGKETVTELVFGDFVDGLKCYQDHFKKYEKIKKLVVGDGSNKIEYDDNVDIFDDTKDEAYVRGYIAKDTEEYNADSEMLYVITLQQLEKDKYEQLNGS